MSSRAQINARAMGKEAARVKNPHGHRCYHCLQPMRPEGKNFYCTRCGSLEDKNGKPAFARKEADPK